MTSTVDIDSKLDDIIEYWDFSPLQNEDMRIARLKTEFKSLIREVAEEVITTKTKRAKSDYENGWNDCVDTCNKNLNRLLGDNK